MFLRHPAAAVRLPLATLLALSLLSFLAPAARAEAAGNVVRQARQEMDRAAMAKTVLAWVHFGADYVDHDYVRTDTVRGEPNDFVLVYRYKWQGDGVTDLGFFCNSKGLVYEVRVLRTNAVLQVPWQLSKAVVQVLGEALIALAGDDAKPEAKTFIRKLITDVDTETLCAVEVVTQQVRGR